MAWYIIFAKTRHISLDVKGPGGSMSYVVGLPNNSYKHITNTA
jgi:hypothetical protein